MSETGGQIAAIAGSCGSGNRAGAAGVRRRAAAARAGCGARRRAAVRGAAHHPASSRSSTIYRQSLGEFLPDPRHRRARSSCCRSSRASRSASRSRCCTASGARRARGSFEFDRVPGTTIWWPASRTHAGRTQSRCRRRRLAGAAVVPQRPEFPRRRRRMWSRHPSRGCWCWKPAASSRSTSPPRRCCSICSEECREAASPSPSPGWNRPARRKPSSASGSTMCCRGTTSSAASMRPCASSGNQRPGRTVTPRSVRMLAQQAIADRGRLDGAEQDAARS